MKQESPSFSYGRCQVAALRAQTDIHITFEKVRAHGTDPDNRRADQLAAEGARGIIRYGTPAQTSRIYSIQNAALTADMREQMMAEAALIGEGSMKLLRLLTRNIPASDMVSTMNSLQNSVGKLFAGWNGLLHG